MVKAFTKLRLEKTNVGVKSNTTFNAPGTYVAPYGKTIIRVGGRGAPGNSGTSGNPSNPGSPGNYTGTNPPQYAYTQPGSPQFVPGTEYPGGTKYETRWAFWPGGAPWGETSRFNSFSGFTSVYFNGYFQYGGPYFPGGDQGEFYTVQYTQYGPAYRPSFSFFQPPYDVFNPGNPNFNPPTAGNPGNPGSAGNAGSNFSLGGVTLPGGAGGNAGSGGSGTFGSAQPGNPGGSGQSAPVISQTTSTLTYTGGGVGVPTPSGGYVTIDNLSPWGS